MSCDHDIVTKSVLSLRKVTIAGVSGLLMLVGAAISSQQASAAYITYNVDQTIGAGGVTGFIETDGATGDLDTSNILDWNLSLNDGTTTFDLLGPQSGSNSHIGGCLLGCIGHPGSSDLSATLTQLLFDFSSPGGVFFFESNDYLNSVCFDNAACLFSDMPAGETLTIGFNTFQHTSLSGTQIIATASDSPQDTPEPASVAIFGVGLLGLMSRRRLSRARPA